MELPSNLTGKTKEEIISIAQDIASETFIKNGNRAVSFTENRDLHILVGGRMENFKEVSKIIIMAYTEKQADLILNNL